MNLRKMKLLSVAVAMLFLAGCLGHGYWASGASERARGGSVIQHQRLMEQQRLAQRNADHARRAKVARQQMLQVAVAPPVPAEDYAFVPECNFAAVLTDPLSTFSIDVDTASYSNIRRLLKAGDWPVPVDAVRIEEMINYFHYDYPQPEAGKPVAITTELADCPWNARHQLLQIGLQAKEIGLDQLPANNLVFLLDVSGSMGAPDKLPLLQKALKLLVMQMRPEDSISMVVYAGAAGVVLAPTSGAEKAKIMAAIDQLEAGGSTAGAEGLRKAYQLARENFKPEGNNRIILATDGDFNVGVSSQSELVHMIEAQRDNGIYLSVFGFGQGNLKDATMEKIADHGNGHYAYIDSLLEARKVLVEEFGSTLLTVAKDVKLQVEFNPAVVESYRLIGYDNRRLQNADFADDKKDAGDMGAGHSVTALYEIIPTTENSEQNTLRYQSAALSSFARQGNELGLVKFRYKRPDLPSSELYEVVIANAPESDQAVSENFRLAAAVTEWGLLLKDSDYKGDASFAHLKTFLADVSGRDPLGLRAEFKQLVKWSADAQKLNKFVQ